MTKTFCFEFWKLEFRYCFGFWILEFSIIWNLGFGIWNFC
jgi:hypothetical protein